MIGRAATLALIVGSSAASAKPRCDLRAPIVDRARVHAYVARDGGVDEIDLATCAARRVYTTPTTPPDFCVRMSRDRPDAPLDDHVIGLADGDRTLVLDRYGVGCHVPDHEHVRITDFADPDAAREHPARRIYALAADGGTLYAIDGDGVWRSRDAGDTWIAVPFAPPDDAGTIGLAPDTIAADGDRLVVATVSLPDLGGGFGAGPVLRSDDGGATWRPAHTKRPRRARTLRVGADRFTATDDGVLRTRAGATARVTPDPARAPRRDLFELYAASR